MARSGWRRSSERRRSSRAACAWCVALAYSDERAVPAGDQERTMSHQPPKQNKKAPQHTAKEKKTLKQQKKHAGDAPAFIKK
jgi:hypothetical protein